MSERDLLRVLMEDAELVRYEHGGARLAVTAHGAKRELIADFYGDGEWREFFMGLVQAEAKRRAELETSPAQCDHSWVTSNFEAPRCLWCHVEKSAAETREEL
jgi:hypothetical protein